jgi:hypothetical protein
MHARPCFVYVFEVLLVPMLGWGILNDTRGRVISLHRQDRVEGDEKRV